MFTSLYIFFRKNVINGKVCFFPNNSNIHSWIHKLTGDRWKVLHNIKGCSPTKLFSEVALTSYIKISDKIRKKFKILNLIFINFFRHLNLPQVCCRKDGENEQLKKTLRTKIFYSRKKLREMA